MNYEALGHIIDPMKYGDIAELQKELAKQKDEVRMMQNSIAGMNPQASYDIRLNITAHQKNIAQIEARISMMKTAVRATAPTVQTKTVVNTSPPADVYPSEAIIKNQFDTLLSMLSNVDERTIMEALNTVKKLASDPSAPAYASRISEEANRKLNEELERRSIDKDFSIPSQSQISFDTIDPGFNTDPSPFVATIPMPNDSPSTADIVSVPVAQTGSMTKLLVPAVIAGAVAFFALR